MDDIGTGDLQAAIGSEESVTEQQAHEQGHQRLERHPDSFDPSHSGQERPQGFHGIFAALITRFNMPVKKKLTAAARVWQGRRIDSTGFDVAAKRGQRGQQTLAVLLGKDAPVQQA